MAETEELKLQVTLVDNATAGLQAMRHQVQELGGGQAAQNLDRFRRQTQEAHEKGLKPFSDDLTEATKRMVPFISGIGGIATGMLAAGYAADKAIEALSEFAREQANIGKISEQTGFDPAAVKMMHETFARAGVGAQEAAKDIAGFAHAMADVTRVNSEIRRKLFEGQKTGAEIEGMQSFFGDLVKFADDPTKFGNRVIEGYEQIKQNLLKRGETPERAAEGAQKFISSVFGVPDVTQLVQFHEKFKAITDEDKARQQSRQAAATEYLKTTREMAEATDRIAAAWQSTLSNMLNSSKAAGWIKDQLNLAAEAAEKEEARRAGKKPKTFQEDIIEPAKKLPDWLRDKIFGPPRTPWQPSTGPTLTPGPGTPQRFTDTPSKYQGFIDSLAFPEATGQIEDRRGEGGGDPGSRQRIIKAGVFDALVDFQVYARAGGALGQPAFFAGTGGLPGFGGGGGGGMIGARPGFGGFRPRRGGGGELGTGSGGGERFGVEGADLGWYQQTKPQGEDALFKAREKFNEELKDPKVRDLFAARMASEVGGQGEEGAQKFGEEVLNRALARKPGEGGGTLREALEGKDKYYPSVMNYGIGTSAENRTRFDDIISKSMRSNLIKWGTGNASGTVGFGRGGFETSRVVGGRGGGPPPAGGGGTGGDVSGVMRGVDPRLVSVAMAGAKYLPPGYTLRPVSGARSAGYGFHPSGRASDWQIYDPKGNPIANRGDDVTGLYTTWARGAYTEAIKNDPEVAKRLGWGGAFGTVPGGSTPDLMHLDLGGHRGLLRPGNILENLGPFSTRAQIDNGMAQRVEGTGKLSVNVNAPKGTSVNAEGGGIFKKTEVTRQTQMEPAATSTVSGD